MLKDPLIRRFASGTLFAAAFIWVAVTQFKVDPETVWVLLKLSVIFVVVLIVVGLVLTPILRLVYRRKSFLDDLDELEDSLEEERPEKDVIQTPAGE